jgi:hypothetical protein
MILCKQRYITVYIMVYCMVYITVYAYTSLHIPWYTQWYIYHAIYPGHPAPPLWEQGWSYCRSSVGRSNGSRLHELNLWMWRYGRGQPCRVTVEEAE